VPFHFAERLTHPNAAHNMCAGTGLDVFAQEPLPADSPLHAAPNLILTPHVAGGSRAGIIAEVAAVLGNCRAVMRGGELKYRIG
jgi:phosphoglycerate dehydrogenase-like enzyme